MTLQRILAVVAAVLLVGAVALALMVPPDQPLSTTLAAIAPGLADSLRAMFGSGAAAAVLGALLERPAWLIPACAGVIVAGAALTRRGGRSARRLR